MAVGYLGAGKCWATAQEAIDAYYSARSPVASVVASDSNYGQIFYVVYPYKSGSAWYYGRKACSTAFGGCTDSPGFAATSSVYGTCTMETPPTGTPTGDPVEQFTDGNLMGWLVVAAMAVAFGFKQMRRAA